MVSLERWWPYNTFYSNFYICRSLQLYWGWFNMPITQLEQEQETLLNEIHGNVAYNIW